MTRSHKDDGAAGDVMAEQPGDDATVLGSDAVSGEGDPFRFPAAAQ